MTTAMKVVVASLPDREKLVAELYQGDQYWGELSQEAGLLTLEIYPNPEGDRWTFELASIVEVLHRAKQELVGDTASVGERRL